jgi:hypothetical protein
VEVYGPALFDSTALAFVGGAAYLEAGGVLYRWENGALQELGSLEPGPGTYRMTADGAGRLWIARLGAPGGGMWTYWP